MRGPAPQVPAPQVGGEAQPSQPEVLGERISRGVSGAVAPAVAAAAETEGAALPFTGSSVVPFAILAMALIAAGLHHP